MQKAADPDPLAELKWVTWMSRALNCRWGDILQQKLASADDYDTAIAFLGEQKRELEKWPLMVVWTLEDLQ